MLQGAKDNNFNKKDQEKREKVFILYSEEETQTQRMCIGSLLIRILIRCLYHYYSVFAKE